ncbi:hypothetical protein SAMN06264364_11017 [Quadrisphaera granulorum]|uniref:CbbX AAA lid domain-containing protein n=1 Tax=Quadrisphaera granulorum TaxID=317664 RepID=A0A316AA81_9ACTN|nr:hypothetical protein [Quadrisphaera granulorum]PWJ53774.1 hypothetical protein BXY45_11017 [Quadrisphaera granulorum]SZE96531.1 hypothetical protein SAMN06264364_11017 [Quadrisphaera granulorum]
MRSRFAREITFPDYSVAELEQIFSLVVAEHEYALAPGASEALRQVLGGLRSGPRAGEDSGNARFVRTLFEQALNRQALRLSRSAKDDVGILERDEVMTLWAQDITEAAQALGQGPAASAEAPRRRRWRT